MPEKYIKSGNLDIWTESFGDPNNEAILLIMGSLTQGIAWPESFCNKLADAGYFVIRYDHRDVGKSSYVDFKKNPYDLDDMTEDAVAVLDGYDIEKAHVVGQSMGGFIAQLMALNYSDRVLSLTSLMSSPDHRPFLDALLLRVLRQHELPPPSKEIINLLRKGYFFPPKDDEGVKKIMMQAWRLYNGKDVPFNEKQAEHIIDLSIERAKDMSAAFNHGWAVDRSPARTEQLKQIDVPTLVIHGEQDPALPVEHGKATAQAIPDAQLVIIPDMGHVILTRVGDTIADEILNFIKQV